MKLHPHQIYFIRKMIDNPKFGCFLSQGAGKTLIILKFIETIKKYEKIKTLIMAPKNPLEATWPFEIQKWGFPFTYHLIKKIDDKIPTDKDIYFITPEKILNENFSSMVLTQKFNCLILDESSKFKNFKSKRFKKLQKLTGLFKRIYLLSGTPSPNSLEQLWPQIYLLDNGERLGKNISAYRAEYFTMNYNGFGYTLRKNHDVKIYDKISDIAESLKISFTKEPIVNNIRVALKPEALRILRDIEYKEIAKITEEFTKAITSIGSQMMTLKQLASGAMYDDNENGTYVEIFNDKIERLKSFIEEQQGNSTLIAFNYKHEKVRILKALQKYSINVIDGTTTTRNRQILIDRWNNNDLQILLGQPQAMAHGLNLQDGGHHILWFSPTYDLELYLQMNARLNRQGQLKQVCIHHLIANDTLDVEIYESLINKQDTQNKLINYLCKYKTLNENCKFKSADI